MGIWAGAAAVVSGLEVWRGGDEKDCAYFRFSRGWPGFLGGLHSKKVMVKGVTRELTWFKRCVRSFVVENANEN